MYNEWFHLRKNAFSLTPDPSFLFLTEQHRAALVGLTGAILQRKGFVVMTGDAGTGKTTLLARVLQFLPASQLQFSAILNTTLTPSEFLESVLLDFGVKDVPASKALRLRKLKELLAQGQAEGRVSALIVDEAHNLSREVLEEIRMLGNFEDAEEKCLQILLVGQPELNLALNRDDLRQLKQRISVRLSLTPLDASQVGEYIQHRWVRAGGEEHPFSPEAIEDIAFASRGIPRIVNALCDNALTAAAEGASSTVQDKHVRKAAALLDLGELPRRLIGFKAAPTVAPVRDVPQARGAAPAADIWTGHLRNVYGKSNGRPAESRWTRWMGKLRFMARHQST